MTETYPWLWRKLKPLKSIILNGPRSEALLQIVWVKSFTINLLDIPRRLDGCAEPQYSQQKEHIVEIPT